MVKVLIFGAVIGVIASYKGLTVSGGAEGVGRAVNESVVASLVAIFMISVVYTQLFLAFYPEANAGVEARLRRPALPPTPAPPRRAAGRAGARCDRRARPRSGIDSVGGYAEFGWDAIKGLRRVGALRRRGPSPDRADRDRQHAGDRLGLVPRGGDLRARGRGARAGRSAPESPAPLFSAFCTTREVVPFIFGFIVAAKVGGGIVAQLGAMRVNEEVDALEAMGISSVTYLVATRMLAAMLMLPVAYLISLGAGQAAVLAGLVRALRLTSPRAPGSSSSTPRSTPSTSSTR